MNVNVRSVIALTRLAVPYLEKTKGNIVNISSIAALRTSPLTPYYSVAKCALDSYTKNAAVIYGSNGIRVNAINPGTVDTDIWKRSDDPRVASFCDKLIKETIVDRMGKPKEIARVIAFLASDEAAFITGSCWLIDGGAMVTPSYFGQS
uniref:Uncharacterized protein n=1 Tax=Panagrolaimus davidi TaxID=227884 RepID=A0A914R3E9_9BILA